MPPSLYGGTERVVSWLTEELVALGHDVTLFASGSKTSANLILVWPKALRLSRRYQDPYAGYAALMEAVAQSADQFDLIHCHSDWIHLRGDGLRDPVIARPRGSVTEIIENGVKGFLVESDSVAAEAISRVGTLDRRRIREAFERRFTVRRITEQYVSMAVTRAAARMA